MDARRVDSKVDSYKSTLSSNQKLILENVESGPLSIVKDLFSLLPRKEIQDKRLDYVLLTTALKRNHKALIKFLLTSGCRAKVEEKTEFHCAPLFYAFEKDDDRTASDLLKKGASIHDKDVNDKSPLEYALQNKKYKLIDVILQNLKSVQRNEKLNPDIKDNVALFHLACHRDKFQAVRIFLKSGFSVNSRSTFDNEKWRGFTCLHFALSGCDAYTADSTVNELLKKDVDFTAQDNKGNTPVHLAFRNGYPRYEYTMNNCYLPKKWLSNLIDKDPTNLEDQFGLSYFHMICRGLKKCEPSLYMNAVQLFLDKGVDINKPVSLEDESYAGYTALHFAVKNLQFDIAKLLLENGANVTKTSKDGITPLHLVCHPSSKIYAYDDGTSEEKKKLLRSKIVELLVEYGAKVDLHDPQGKTPIHLIFYSKGNNEPLTRFLLSKSQFSDNHTDSHGLSYLHIASTMDFSAVKTLIERGASIDACIKSDSKVFRGCSALHLAVSFNKSEIVEYLLDHGANASIHIEDDIKATPLYLASRYTFTVLHQAEDWKINVDLRNDAQSLHSAKMKIIELLLKHGANINETDVIGNTPLANAVMIFRHFKKCDGTEPNFDFDIGQREMIELLLRNGANVHFRTKIGESILHLIASQEGYSQRVTFSEMMLERGVDVNAVDDEGLTALHVAVGNLYEHKSDIPLIKLFEKYGVNFNAMSVKFGTPLHAVIDKLRYEPERDEIVDYLLARPDIELDAQNSTGETPLHIAVEKCMHDAVISCLEKLLHSGADINLVNSEGLSPLHRLYGWLQFNLEDDPDEDFDDEPHEMDEYVLKTFEVVATFLKKLKKINGFINEEVSEKFEKVLQLCPEKSAAIDLEIEEELDKLKSQLVSQHTSLHELLFKDVNEMIVYVNNNNFQNIIASSGLRTQFPIFHDILHLQYRRGLRRSLILEKGKRALALLSNVNWPEYCAEYILKFLTDEDLRALAESVSSRSCRLESRQGCSERELPQKRSR